MALDTTKIKVKIGDSEFEAEGPVEIVHAQFASFKEMITAAPRQETEVDRFIRENNEANKDTSTGSPHVPLERIMHVSGRVVSLTALPASIEDAALLVMLGHKDVRNNLSVTGQELGDGLAQSGRPVARVDRVMEKAINSAFVLKSGIKRSTRYRLTNQGLSKALTIAKELMSSLP